MLYANEFILTEINRIKILYGWKVTINKTHLTQEIMGLYTEILFRAKLCMFIRRTKKLNNFYV